MLTGIDADQPVEVKFDQMNFSFKDLNNLQDEISVWM